MSTPLDLGVGLVELDREALRGVTGDPANQQAGSRQRQVEAQPDELTSHGHERSLLEQGSRTGDVGQDTTPLLVEAGAEALEVGHDSGRVTPLGPLPVVVHPVLFGRGEPWVELRTTQDESPVVSRSL